MSVYNLVDPSWEIQDPNPDIFALFVEFNNAFFDGALGCVEVKWSRRMTLCAGLCRYSGRAGCSVVLSEPLLKLRPRRDLIETLLHEMIHAYLFVAEKDRQRDSHGPSFIKHMKRINSLTGTNITVYHSFHDEVNFYKVHVWKCNGPCQGRAPYYGKLSRAMNRAPGPSDPWYAEHQRTCGGTYIKIAGPEPQPKTSTANKGTAKLPPASNSSHRISEYFTPVRSDKPKAADKKVPPSASYTPTAAASNNFNYPFTSSWGSPVTSGQVNGFVPNNTKENKGAGKTTGTQFKFPTKGGTSTTTTTGSGKTAGPFKFPARGGTSMAAGSRAVTVITLDDDDDVAQSGSGSGNTLNNINQNSFRPTGQVKKPADTKSATSTNPNSSVPTSQTKKPENRYPSNFISSNSNSPRPPIGQVNKPDTSKTSTFVPFSGKGYTLGGGGGGQTSGVPPYKKPKY